MKIHFATKGTHRSAGDGPVGDVTALLRDRRISLIAALALSCCVALQVSNAQLTILHSFGDGTAPNDGARPQAGLIQGPDGNLYGTTYDQAANLGQGYGTVFRLTPGGSVQIVRDFDASEPLSPYAGLLSYNGKLVGISVSGGRYNDGAIFRMTLGGKTARWHDFIGTDGTGSQYASLIVGADGDLYGTATFGGSDNAGTVYKLSSTRPHTLTVLYSFPRNIQHQGVQPGAGLLLGQDGNYYGTTQFDGTTTGGGLIFQITPSGQITYLHQFGQNDGGTAALIQAKDGTFYGTTRNLIFKMTPTFVVTTIHKFGIGISRRKDGGGYRGVVFGPNGNLYGVAGGGGTLGGGTIFELGPEGANYTILHNFGFGSKTLNDGVNPNGPLVLGSDNNFYGTTANGGSANLGTVFKFSP